MRVEIVHPNGELIAEIGELAPMTYEWSADRRAAFDVITGALGVPSVFLRADMRAYNRALDSARRALNRLRYPSKAPAHGSVSRRREKLRKAGIRR